MHQPPKLGPTMIPTEYADVNIVMPRAMFVSSHISATIDLVITTKPKYE